MIGPRRGCLEVVHKRIMDDAMEHNVRQSLAKCAGNTNDKLRCYRTVPTDFGEECWDLVRKLILKNITPAEFSSDLRLCHRVGLVESCFQQSIVQTIELKETRKILEQFQGTYRCVTK